MTVYKYLQRRKESALQDLQFSRGKTTDGWKQEPDEIKLEINHLHCLRKTPTGLTFWNKFKGKEWLSSV